MYVVKKMDGTLTKDYREILSLQHSYYKELYTKDDRVKFNLVNETGVHIEESVRLQMEEVISVDECFDAMMTLKHNKTPGSDGLGLRFYPKYYVVPCTVCLCMH